jgi:TRAP-type C4-dicarboxylate transport system substrate-binding protein
MKKSGFVFIILLLAFPSLVFAQKTFELKYVDWSPPTAGISKINQKMLDMITEKSGGRIKITAYFGESLLKMAEVFKGVQQGLADISYWTVGAPGSPERLAMLMRLPVLGIPSTEAGTEFVRRLFETSPDIAQEYKGIEVLGLRMMPFSEFHSVKKLVKKPADMKGMKVITTGIWADYMKLNGAAPVALGVGDWYLSLERGLVEAQITHFPAAYIFKTLDIFKYHTMIHASGVPSCIFVNRNTWASLPPDLQKVLKEAAEWQAKEIVRFDHEEEERAIEYAKKRGNTFYSPTPEEMKEWYQSFKLLHEEFVNGLEKEGLPAKKVYDRLVELLEKYRK